MSYLKVKEVINNIDGDDMDDKIGSAALAYSKTESEHGEKLNANEFNAFQAGCEFMLELPTVIKSKKVLIPEEMAAALPVTQNKIGKGYINGYTIEDMGKAFYAGREVFPKNDINAYFKYKTSEEFISSFKK